MYTTYPTLPRRRWRGSGGQTQGMVRHSRWPAAPAVIANLVPFAVLAIRAMFSAPVALYGDDAVNELNLDRALRGRQLLGPYSRFGWHHPGPAFAYLAVPVRAILGPSGH